MSTFVNKGEVKNGQNSVKCGLWMAPCLFLKYKWQNVDLIRGREFCVYTYVHWSQKHPMICNQVLLRGVVTILNFSSLFYMNWGHFLLKIIHLLGCKFSSHLENVCHIMWFIDLLVVKGLLFSTRTPKGLSQKKKWLRNFIKIKYVKSKNKPEKCC